MDKWKKHDIAIAVRSFHRSFTKGKAYVVLQISGDWIRMIDDEGKWNGWSRINFERIPYETLTKLERAIYDIPHPSKPIP